MKKRSAAKLPEHAVFFIDRSLGKYDVPAALKQAGYRCEIHDDHFAPETEDAEWLRMLASKAWVVLTKDERIRYRPLESAALREAGLQVFIAVCGNLTGADTGKVLVKAMPRIVRTVQQYAKQSFICYVYKDGTLKMK